MVQLTEKELAKDRFITINRKDYTGIQTPRRKPFIPEWRDIIKAHCKSYLRVDKDKLKDPQEDADKYLTRFKEQHKKIGKCHFKEPLNHLDIQRELIIDKSSHFMMDYGRVGKESLNVDKKVRPIPPEWVCPETHLQAYINPVILDEMVMKPKLVIIPPTSLVQNEKINEILKIRTGNTTYEDSYGKTGEFIKKFKGKKIQPKEGKYFGE